jgi:hypothetical protein
MEPENLLPILQVACTCLLRELDESNLCPVILLFEIHINWSVCGRLHYHVRITRIAYHHHLNFKMWSDNLSSSFLWICCIRKEEVYNN